MESRGSASNRRAHRVSRNRKRGEKTERFTIEVQPLGLDFTLMAVSWKDAFDKVWAQLDEKQRKAVIGQADLTGQ